MTEVSVAMEEVEEYGDEVSEGWHEAEGLLKDAGEGYEDEGSAFVGLYVGGEDGGKDDDASHDGYEGVDEADFEGCADEVCVFAEVAGIGAHAAHGEAEGVEGLSHGVEDGLEGDFREVGPEEEGESFACARCEEGTDGQDEQDDKEEWHQHFRDTLNAAFDPAYDDEVGYEDESAGIEDGEVWIGDKAAEVVFIVWYVAAEYAEAVAQRIDEVAQGPP